MKVETESEVAQSCPTPSDPMDCRNTGVGCHFLLQCMKGKTESEVAQQRPTLRDPTDGSLPGSSTHGIFQAGVLEWVAIVYSPSYVATITEYI